MRIFRYTFDGERDPDFGDEGIARFTALDFGAPGLVVRPDATILATGGENDFTVIGLTPGDALDPAFGGDGVVTTDFGSTDTPSSLTLWEGGLAVVGNSAGRLAMANYLTDPASGGWVSVADTSVAEDAGVASFVVTRTTSTGNVTVDYATADGTATTLDYGARSGTVTFADGETEKTVTVPVRDNQLDEFAEQFTVQLSNPSGVSLGDPTASGMILDEDPAPAISIRDVSRRRRGYGERAIRAPPLRA